MNTKEKITKCLVDKCSSKARALNYCEKHYLRFKKTGDPEKTLWDKRKENKIYVCTIDDCNLSVLHMGFCSGHYKRYITHGNPLYSPLRKQKYGLKGCSVEDCNKPHNAKGLCNTHYIRFNRYGNVDTLREKDKSVKNGYIIIGSKMEHRVVMEEHLGRKLLPHENIHHKNGDRADNRIENLELWSTFQPSGQRICDKIDYAVEILEQYAPHLIKGENND